MCTETPNRNKQGTIRELMGCTQGYPAIFIHKVICNAKLKMHTTGYSTLVIKI
jgi:hypothetical protein